jgi:rod shape-determining protein MreB and related proteins
MSPLGFLKDSGAEIYVDLGTANTLVMTRDRGLIANEPSVVAYREIYPGKKEVVAVGAEAKLKIGRTPGNLVASFPLKDGVIADLDITEAMLRYFINRARGRFGFLRPRVVISLPFGVSDIEKKAVRDAGASAGAREIILIEEPMAAAIGAALPIEEPKGNMIIDIGGGTTEIAVISLFGIVHCEAVRIGGHAFDETIVDYIRRKFNVIVGHQSAERLKIQIGSALPGDHSTSATIRGIDHITGLPKELRVTSAQVHEALAGDLDEIITAAKRTLEQIPADLIPDIIRDGVKVAGGGALLRDLDKRLREELQIPVWIVDDPLLAIARGGSKALRDRNLLERIALA